MDTIDPIIHLRKKLHQIPELAGNENETANEIISFLKEINPDYLYSNIVGTGIIAVFDSKKPGPHIVFRAEMDGLPITEENKVHYVSKNNGCSHSCGHDGHIAILLGLGQYISDKKDSYSGKIILLFQPAEEIAKGAKDIIKDNILDKFNPTHIFSFHNLPGYPLGQIIIKNGIFASASQGLILNIHGKTSHAGHPNQGNNPMHAIIEIINSLENISNNYNKKEKGTFLTVIHVKLGERAFGTSPGHAVIMATYRSKSQSLLQNMANESLQAIEQIISKNNLFWDHEWVEVFPEINNNPACVDIIHHAAQKLDLSVNQIDKPFAWSEDFSHYLQHYNGAFFGIGSGLKQKPLHNPSYDFPDTLLSIGISLYKQIISETTRSYNGE